MKMTFAINGCTFEVDGDRFFMHTGGNSNLSDKLQTALNGLFTLVEHVQVAADLVEDMEQTERDIADLREDLMSCQARYDEQRDKLFDIGVYY